MSLHYLILWNKVDILQKHFEKDHVHMRLLDKVLRYAKCGFWANFVPTSEYKTSRDLATDGPIFANLVSKDA